MSTQYSISSKQSAAIRFSKKRLTLANRLSPGRGILRGVFRSHQSLRILCYHGVVPDTLAGVPWVPDYFVTESQFREQMLLAKSFGQIVRLSDVYSSANASRRLSAPQIAVTFDDVAACAFAYARPTLNELNIPATFFVSTGLVSSRRLPAADMVRLLRAYPKMQKSAASPAIEEICREPASHKALNIQTLQRILARVDGQVLTNAPQEAVHTLKPLSWLQLRSLVDDGHEVGGHTVDHAILARQVDRTRTQQIAKCYTDIQENLNIDPVGFAYPNGGPGDFGMDDADKIRAAGFDYAVTTAAGFCSSVTPRYALPRVSVGMGHTRMRFMLELSGLLDRRRRRQHGWT